MKFHKTIPLLFITGLFFLVSCSKSNTPAEQIKTAKAVKGDLRIEVIATGVVTPDVEVIVKSKAGGEITGFPFNEGDNVQKGQAIVRLDPKTEKARANQAEANLLMAKAKLEKARISLKDWKIKLERQKKLFDEGIIARQELDDAEVTLEKGKSDVSLAEAELFQMKEALKEANERLSDTEIKAPFTGTILKKYVDQGQVISSTVSSASEGTQIFSIANLDNIFVSAQVDEVDISKIQTGQEASVQIDSMPDKSFKAAVARIAPKGKVERTVTIFEVVLMITDSDKALLKPGMTADVKVLTNLVKDALLIPKEALNVKDNSTGVYVLKGNKPEWVPVKTGETDGVSTAVHEGISPGEDVITSGLNSKPGKTPKKKFFF
ncbi:MAG: efflux RND transporter periplasmic adaptor subunit [Deltaproteobacteria bacterium]|nr:efflux RND transporter periplasmic adaptor subunit [Deltaproteobacteria bacterium]